MRLTKRQVLAFAFAFGAAALAASGSPLLAQPPLPVWPRRTVRVIVPNPPGVAMDVIARLFAERLSARWGQPVIVENMPGADGIPAMREFVMRADDHTLMYSFPGLITINPVVHEKLPYDPVNDLVPVAGTSRNYLAIAVSTSTESRSLKELAQLAKTKPGKITWTATPGLPFYAFTAFGQGTGADMVQVPYRDFNQALVDLSEGRIDAAASGVLPLLPHVRSGKVRLLAFLNRLRSPVAPDVPTAAEAGYANLTFEAMTGFFGGRGMPDALRDRIAADVREIAGDPGIGERLSKMGAIAGGTSPAEYAALIEDERAKIAAVARTPKPAQ